MLCSQSRGQRRSMIPFVAPVGARGTFPSRGSKVKNLSAIPSEGIVSIPTAAVQPSPSAGRSLATRDPGVIRAWAVRYAAEPATGEATASGPATIDVKDGGVGIRFNFPGVGRFRPISWDEWFDQFERDQLVFVFEQEVADRAYSLWQARGGEHGRDRQDWFEAERQLRDASTEGSSARYWFVHRESDNQEESSRLASPDANGHESSRPDQ
jgi:hypothetical protein